VNLGRSTRDRLRERFTVGLTVAMVEIAVMFTILALVIGDPLVLGLGVGVVMLTICGAILVFRLLSRRVDDRS
jgi:hypothetical protein